MTTFDEREKGFEAKYKLDQELAFKVNARRGKLLGLWAAAKMGLSGAEAQAYAKSVVEADFAQPGPDDIVRKLMADLAASGHGVSEEALQDEMDRQTALARQQIIAENKK
jgi:hypothetical protein